MKLKELCELSVDDIEIRIKDNRANKIVNKFIYTPLHPDFHGYDNYSVICFATGFNAIVVWAEKVELMNKEREDMK